MFAAIDVGFGYTKALSGNGGRSIFPSAVTPARGTGDLAAALGGGSVKHRMTATIQGVGEREYLVGSAALAAGATRSWSADGDGRADYAMLVLAALASVGASGLVDVALGLPLSIYLQRDQRRTLRDHIWGLRAAVSWDGRASTTVEAASVRVLSQAVGAYYAALLGPDGAKLAGQAVGAVDIGYHTTDFLLLTPGDGGVSIPDEARSGSLDAGMSQATDAVRQHVVNQTGTPFSPPEGMIEAALRNGGHITVRGESIDIRPVYDEALRSLATRIQTDIQRALGQQIDYLAASLLAGGGGAEIAPYLHLPAMQVVPDPVFANAAGFLQMLARPQR